MSASPTTERTSIQRATPSDEEVERVLYAVFRRLQSRIEQGGEEGVWASDIEREALEEVFRRK